MRRHGPETQTLYAQLLENTIAHEFDLVGGFANGLAIERRVRERHYLYWQLRDLDGRLRQRYLGPADDPKAQALRDALVATKIARGPIVEELRRLTAAYVASGGVRHQQEHFKVVDTLARAGVFNAGVVLVGSHAFVSIGAALGVTWSAADAGTADVDLCRDEFVSIACEEPTAIDLPGALRSVEPSFFLIPSLNIRDRPPSMKAGARGVKVDLLTTARTPRDVNPKPMPTLGLAAQPLRHMDYLVRDEVRRALFVGPHAVVVRVPDAGRFALHKLAVATRRAPGEASIKSQKDRRQSDALIAVLRDIQPGGLDAAARAARVRKDRGLVRDMRVAATKLSPGSRRHVLSLLDR
jgi:hypothetical protein